MLCLDDLDGTFDLNGGGWVILGITCITQTVTGVCGLLVTITAWLPTIYYSPCNPDWFVNWNKQMEQTEQKTLQPPTDSQDCDLYSTPPPCSPVPN